MFGDTRLPSITEDECFFLWSGLVNGFPIVDEDCPATYYCQNCDSILETKAYTEMSNLLDQEIADHKVTRIDTRPRCVHSLGAVWKSNGKLRPITDYNNYMSTTFKSFTYNSVQDAVDVLAQGEFMAVVDISSAYRSVSVKADQVCYQGLVWDFGNGPEYLQDNRMCFSLRCAPNIFDVISSFIVKIAESKGAPRVINYLDDFLVIAESPYSFIFRCFV